MCEGSDFEMNNKPDTIDVAVVHLYSDHWSACDESCKLDFASNWVWPCLVNKHPYWSINRNPLLQVSNT